MNSPPRTGFPQVSPQLGQSSRTLPPPTPIHARPAAQVGAVVGAPVAAALPYVADKEPQVRFSLQSRTGQHWSYPYSYLGLIELPSPDILSLHCNSRELALIEIRGRSLGEIARLLATHRIVSITETDHPAYARTGVCVSDILVNRVASEP